ncbi:MAG: hypothetical protein QM756_25065 [Polyangiaceae bacterium]
MTDFAVGTPPTVAALVDGVVRVFDGRRWKALPKPEGLPAELEYRLFFGRDNQPRLMGYSDASAPRAFYRRYKNGSFQPEPSELGPLGAAAGALYGVLGYTDPEVVCKPHELCLIKTLSGWKRVKAHDAAVPVFLGGGGAWALFDRSLQQLSETGFAPFSPSRVFERPVSVWVDPDKAPWVLDAGAAGLFRVVQGEWQKIQLALTEPAAVWGKGSSDIWVVSRSGAAHFDGVSFRCVRELNGDLRFVMPAGDTVWFAGAAGAYRVSAAKLALRAAAATTH